MGGVQSRMGQQAAKRKREVRDEQGSKTPRGSKSHASPSISAEEWQLTFKIHHTMLVAVKLTLTHAFNVWKHLERSSLRLFVRLSRRGETREIMVNPWGNIHASIRRQCQLCPYDDIAITFADEDVQVGQCWVELGVEDDAVLCCEEKRWAAVVHRDFALVLCTLQQSMLAEQPECCGAALQAITEMLREDGDGVNREQGSHQQLTELKVQEVVLAAMRKFRSSLNIQQHACEALKSMLDQGQAQHATNETTAQSTQEAKYSVTKQADSGVADCVLDAIALPQAASPLLRVAADTLLVIGDAACSQGHVRQAAIAVMERLRIVETTNGEDLCSLCVLLGVLARLTSCDGILNSCAAILSQVMQWSVQHRCLNVAEAAIAVMGTITGRATRQPDFFLSEVHKTITMDAGEALVAVLSTFAQHFGIAEKTCIIISSLMESSVACTSYLNTKAGRTARMRAERLHPSLKRYTHVLECDDELERDFTVLMEKGRFGCYQQSPDQERACFVESLTSVEALYNTWESCPLWVCRRGEKKPQDNTGEAFSTDSCIGFCLVRNA